MIFVTTLGFSQIVIIEGPRHRTFGLPNIERLHQVIKRPQTESIDGTLDRLHATNHDDHGGRRNHLDVRDHLQA